MMTKLGEMVPHETRECTGHCPRCGHPVKWVALWDPERGAMPGGTPVCEACAAKDGADQAAGVSWDDPELQHLHEAGVYVPDHRDMTLAAWDPTHDAHRDHAVHLVEALTKGTGREGPDLFLWGSTGNGKTSLAVACIRSLIRSGIEGRRMWFVRSRAFLRQLGDAYRSGGSGELVGRAKGARLLVLDEFGKEPPTQHSVDLLAEIIDERRGATILTSNHGLEELVVRYSHVDGMEHLISRLGPRRFRHLEFTGPDRRWD